MKYYDVNKRSQVSIGERFGCLVITDGPYYTHPKSSNVHRRQYFDAVCDCGKTKERMFGGLLKKESLFTYCCRECPIYNTTLPKDVPESSKKCKLGFEIHKLTVVREAFYHKERGDANRHKYVEVECECGIKKLYRDDKVFRGAYKSCGCSWEYSGNKEKSWKYYEKTYGLSQEDYEKMLASQDGVCAICQSPSPKTSKTKSLFVDHCHTTGKVRGLLCNNCNFSIGGFNDDISLLKSAITYLEKHTSES